MREDVGRGCCGVAATTSIPGMIIWPNPDARPSRKSKTPAILAKERGDLCMIGSVITSVLIVFSFASWIRWVLDTAVVELQRRQRRQRRSIQARVLVCSGILQA